MKTPSLLAGIVVIAIAGVLAFAPRAQAGCVIAPDGKSIDVVTDNGESVEKNCAVKCQVDTKVGVVQVSCGGNTPPLAKGHSLCNFDKPEPWYKRVVSSEDSCKSTPAAAPAAAAPAPAAPLPGGFACRILPDGRSAEMVIANPHKRDASCSADCQISTTRAGTTFQLSCSKEVAAGSTEAVLCRRTFERGNLVKVIGGNGACINPDGANDPADKAADDDEDDDKTMKQMQEMQKQGLEMLEKLRKR